MVVPRFESVKEKNARLKKARKDKEDSFQVYFEEKLNAAVKALPYGSKIKKSEFFYDSYNIVLVLYII